MNTTRQRATHAFTLIELLIVIAIIAILAAILFPVFAQARAKARQSACLSNQKQIGLAVLQYVQDYDETYPRSNRAYQNDEQTGQSSWMRHLYTYTKNRDIFSCPDSLYSANLNAAGNTNSAAGCTLGSTQEECDVYFVKSGSETNVTNANNANANLISITGPNGDATQRVIFPRRSLGVNRWVVMPNKGGAPTSETATTNFRVFTESSIGKIAELPLIADAGFAYFDNGWYVTCANYNKPNYANANEVGGAIALSLRQDPPAKWTRHSGGSNILYADGHAKWSQARSINYTGDTKPGYPTDAVSVTCTINGTPGVGCDPNIYAFKIPFAPDDLRLR